MRSCAPTSRTTGPRPVIAQYEAMRAAALGQALSPEARYGLILFLRRGMWAWAQALAAEDATPEPRQSTTLTSPAPQDPRGVVELLVALVLNVTEGSPS